MLQLEAFNLLKLGKNVFLTGEAGSGKTYLLNQYIRYLKDNDVKIAVTASLGNHLFYEDNYAHITHHASRRRFRSFS
jgi:GTPase SAR1 family protein